MSVVMVTPRVSQPARFTWVSWRTPGLGLRARRAIARASPCLEVGAEVRSAEVPKSCEGNASLPCRAGHGRVERSATEQVVQPTRPGDEGRPWQARAQATVGRDDE